MTARTTRRTRLLAAVATTAGGLAFALLPTTAAQAAGEPVFSFVDNVTLDARQGSANGTTTASLIPAGYRAYDIDVTPSGTTSVMSLCKGTVAACTDKPAGSRFDGTYGVVYQRADGTSRLVTNLTNTNPVITADGSKVMWVYANTLHTFLTASETYAPNVALAAATTELPVSLAASSDGANVAVIFADDAATTAARVLAMTVASGKAAGAAYFEKSYPRATALRPSPWVFTFVDATTLAYDEYDGTDAGVRSAVKAVLSVGNATPAAPLSTLLQNYYQLRQDVGGNWWAWKDSGASATVANIDDPLAATPVLTFGLTRSDGANTYDYTPSAAAPPALDATKVANPALSHPAFGFTTRTVVFGGKTAYQTYNLYGGLPDGAYAAKTVDAAETDRGELWRSYDGGGANTAKWLDTSGAKPVVIGSSYFNGYATSLKRNTWFQWRSAGDAFTTAFTTGWIKVSVVPVVTVKAAISGSSRIVTGTATRPAGTVYLQKYVSGKWYTVTRVALVKTGSYTGRYAFAKRALKKGSYRTITVSDTYAASGYKIFVV